MPAAPRVFSAARLRPPGTLCPGDAVRSGLSSTVLPGAVRESVLTRDRNRLLSSVRKISSIVQTPGGNSRGFLFSLNWSTSLLIDSLTASRPIANPLVISLI